MSSSSSSDESLASLDQLDLPEEFPEVSLMKEGKSKDECQARPSHLGGAGGTAKQGAPWATSANLSPMPGPFASAIMEEQFAAELNFSSEKPFAKKTQSMMNGKRAVRPSCLPQAIPGKSVPQEMKPSVASKVVLERKAQAPVSGGLLRPAIFSPISGFPVLGRIEKYSLGSSGPRQPVCIPVRKPVAIRKREAELVARNDNPSRDAAPRGLFPASSLGFSHPSAHRGGYNDGDPKTGPLHISANSQFLAMAQGGFRPRAPLPVGEQGFLRHARQERKQPLAEPHCCPQCPLLQKEIDHLKDELAALHCLMSKFQML
ncbi:uncharacterized protein CXorf49-like [Dasypus novemcinctus]|uniref:uncharacterized protein CXorf49-like n=1 Tax=Dasypus novemcinctus TaxID=9361 RepID=UPI00265E5D77|nr:uncharacterized protein CXorf49-like [Dasypus novemcinctus]